MLNPFKKKTLHIKTPTPFKKEERKPSIIDTFTHFHPESPLKRSHRAQMSLCPFHGENNPSFAMYEETNSYFCFSCQETGDSYSLIMKTKDIDFKDALEYARSVNLLQK